MAPQSSSPAQLVNQGLLGEIRRSDGVKARLAQEDGMASRESTRVDHAEAVQEEKEKMHRTLRERFGNAVPRIFRNETSTNDNVEGLHKLPCLRGLPSLNRGARHDIDASRFWAILIGIDAYERWPLRGCVSDALLIKSFLVNKLGVPEERIQCLLSSKNSIPSDALTPSRANIVEVLYSLIDKREVVPGDNIIVYYAGYGSCYDCADHSLESQCDKDSCPIEALCPLDRDTQDDNGKWIPDISDRELNALFTEISRVKGHKITFITDCYYARSF